MKLSRNKLQFVKKLFNDIFSNHRVYTTLFFAVLFVVHILYLVWVYCKEYSFYFDIQLMHEDGYICYYLKKKS